jgi:polar amino acid transport system substrate-binding protein
MAWSDATDLKSREKTVDILDYVRQGQGFMWKKGGTAINSVLDACGLKVAVNQGSDAIGYVQSITKKCTAAGKPAITMQTFPSQDTSVLAVKSGRVDATVNASETNAWVAQHSGGSLLAGGPTFFNGVSGIVFPKHSQLLKVMRLALVKLQANGQYQKVFAKYGIPHNVVKHFTINGGLS